MSSTALAKIALPAFVHAAAVVTAFTILLCYTLAVSHGHVKPWLPMISDCAVYSPEKYPFRLGLAASSMLLSASVVFIYRANMIYSRNKVALCLGLIATFCLGIVSVVNEAENNIVHSGAAVIFYFFYWFYMIILTWGHTAVRLCKRRVCNKPCKTEGKWVHPNTTISVFRHLLTILCGLALIVFAIMSMNWGKYHLYIAICEWSGTLFIVMFNWSYASDLSRISLVESRDNTMLQTQDDDDVQMNEKTKLLP